MLGAFFIYFLTARVTLATHWLVFQVPRASLVLSPIRQPCQCLGATLSHLAKKPATSASRITTPLGGRRRRRRSSNFCPTYPAEVAKLRDVSKGGRQSAPKVIFWGGEGGVSRVSRVRLFCRAQSMERRPVASAPGSPQALQAPIFGICILLRPPLVFKGPCWAVRGGLGRSSDGLGLLSSPPAFSPPADYLDSQRKTRAELSWAGCAFGCEEGGPGRPSELSLRL